MREKDLVVRIETRLVPQDNGCLIWPGDKKRGYGVVKIGKHKRRIHRILWERHVGEVPEGWDLHHDCENKACGNLGHIRLITKADHTRLHCPPKTHCGKGHALEGYNLRVSSNGHRHCRACDRNKPRKPADYQKVRHLRCRNGHERTTENTFVLPNGGLRCLECPSGARLWGRK